MDTLFNMSDLYANKYRIPSARLQSWNYACEGMYFVTICTKNRVCYFGEIVEKRDDDTAAPTCQLHPTEIGEIAQQEWFKTPQLRPDMHIELGEFTVMPNHIHGIIMIGENEYNSRRDAMHGVSGLERRLGP
ncbi:MAG: glucose-6-phosphate dehydrogenase [Saprospiraceae bacterium]|nr:glucose-6-phosphate dehydrogenase [Saprospiraceae bacterium]